MDVRSAPEPKGRCVDTYSATATVTRLAIKGVGGFALLPLKEPRQVPSKSTRVSWCGLECAKLIFCVPFRG